LDNDFRINSKIKKLIRAHVHHIQLQDELKRHVSFIDVLGSWNPSFLISFDILGFHHTSYSRSSVVRIPCHITCRSQVQLQKLVEELGLDAAQHIGSEDINIISDEEVQVLELKKDYMSPAKKQMQLQNTMEAPGGSILGSFSLL